MRFFTVLPLLFAAALAAPATNAVVSVARAPKPGISDITDKAKSVLDTKTADGCEVVKCIAALAPASVTCAAALVEDGLNPIADAACFATALNTALNPKIILP
ncbi:uncharacterized protein BDR25DRAFT_309714 [Lindgomyces ingoldianus]|uniref:Uncharacterized protein n=1 Tax=Lindgomyces ingoldianus TaxID=673940 RepID=A0ACB6RDA4_9PLEO|nr:uncharacterized protein BDR25DRAFT_309714 [Lindgomyces ingoldianus]KAF2476300.1 hypothetical protein BDR25DRAFT_309714 [Lindgomyces ingoldianus]